MEEWGIKHTRKRDEEKRKKRGEKEEREGERVLKTGGRGVESRRCDQTSLSGFGGGGVCGKKRSLSLVLCFSKARREYIC